MKVRSNKTIICSVLFLDIIEYSKKSVAEQISLKERFNDFLSSAIEKVPVEDRIILDTGDGAAVTFLGDIEDGLQAALSMRLSLLSDSRLVENKLLVRMGINLGPARLTTDINGQINLVGDGINVAQRVMNFSEPGQILVSRSYYDAVSRISEEFAGLFHYQGSKTDKHVRDHEVYAIGYPGETPVRRSVVDRRLAYENILKSLASLGSRLAAAWRTKLPVFQDFYLQKKSLFVQLPMPNKLIFVVLMIAPMILVTVFVAKMSLKSDQPSVSQHVVEVPVVALNNQSATGKTEQKSTIETKPIAEAKQENTPSSSHEAEPKKKVPPAVQSGRKPEATVEPGKIIETSKTVGNHNQADGMGEVTLIVKPWGEIYLDGKKQGISPPLMTLKMPIGHHEIEIRNGSSQEYKTSVEVLDAKKVTVNHVFN
jgi:hypothetical protein